MGYLEAFVLIFIFLLYYLVKFVFMLMLMLDILVLYMRIPVSFSVMCGHCNEIGREDTPSQLIYWFWQHDKVCPHSKCGHR